MRNSRRWDRPERRRKPQIEIFGSEKLLPRTHGTALALIEKACYTQYSYESSFLHEPMIFRLRKDIGRRVPTKRTQAQQDAEELAYWLSRSAEERADAVGFLTRRRHFLQTGRALPPLDKRVGRRVRANDA